MSSESYLIKQEQCPICIKEGRDFTGDNLAVYSDGHTWCYSGHGFVSGGSKLTQFINKQVKELPLKDILTLPIDCDILYPQKCIDWVGQYGLNQHDLLNNNVLWSETMQRLIFPIYGDGGLIAWQGRWFGKEDAVKWWGRGDLKNTFNILGKGNKLVLVEDVLSAIKVSRVSQAMPLYGNAIGIARFKRLYSLYGRRTTVLIWLDPDMRTHSLTELRRGLLCGLDVQVIFSDKDPKEEDMETIREKLK